MLLRLSSPSGFLLQPWKTKKRKRETINQEKLIIVFAKMLLWQTTVWRPLKVFCHLASSEINRFDLLFFFCTVIPKCCALRPQRLNETGRRGTRGVVPKRNQCEFAAGKFLVNLLPTRLMRRFLPSLDLSNMLSSHQSYHIMTCTFKLMIHAPLLRLCFTPPVLKCMASYSRTSWFAQTC